MVGIEFSPCFEVWSVLWIPILDYAIPTLQPTQAVLWVYSWSEFGLSLDLSLSALAALIPRLRWSWVV